MTATRADVCAAAIADAFADDGELFASPMGLLPMLGVRLCRLTQNPDLVISDGESLFLASPPPLFAQHSVERDVVEGWIPFRRVFDVVAHGQRHVMMGATQIDRFGNQNISCIGPWERPRAQLIGVRGAPGNTVNHPTSYFIPKHSPRVFVPRVDMVSGVGYDRGAISRRGASRVPSKGGVVPRGQPVEQRGGRDRPPAVGEERVAHPAVLGAGVDTTRSGREDRVGLETRAAEESA